jgi:hypothetical protein
MDLAEILNHGKEWKTLTDIQRAGRHSSKQALAVVLTCAVSVFLTFIFCIPEDYFATTLLDQ